MDELKKLIREVPDYPKPGILFKDITPLLNDPAAFQHQTEALLLHFPSPGRVTA